MPPALPLEKMSIEEKIYTMETLWDDLCRLSNGGDSPDWHRGVLAGREAAIEQGEDSFEDWEVAKKNIRKQVS